MAAFAANSTSKANIIDVMLEIFQALCTLLHYVCVWYVLQRHPYTLWYRMH